MSVGNKAADLQLQMRQNVEELHSFVRELENWEADIKTKDEELRTGVVQEVQKKLPPVRNRDYRAKKREKKKKEEVVTGDGDTKTEEAKQASRIKSYDYQSWDKFDVEKVMEEMDKEEDCPAESNESDSEEASVDPEKALAEKEKGNNFFKDGKYDDAIECYTRGEEWLLILTTPCFPQTEYAVAESDCNLAIALDSKYFKAYARRGAARFALKKYEPALEDYEMVLKLEPDNTEAQNEIKKIREVAAVASKAAEPLEAPAVDPDQQRQIEEQQRRQEAVFQKDRGNAYFKEGKYEAAVECYTRGMEADHMNVLLPANRAMAYLKLEKFKEAEEDCTKAIFLDSTYSKAFARRGTARVALGKLEEARQGAVCLCFYEPKKRHCVFCLFAYTGSSGRLQAANGSQMRTVQPIDKPTHLRSTKPLRRIDIEEISGKIVVPEEESGAYKPLVQEVVKEVEEASSPLSTSPSAKMIKIEELSEVPSQPKQPEQAETVHPPPEPSTEPSSTGTDLPPPPTNSFQLEADLRRIGNQPETVYRYLKQIKSEAYAKIFHNSLEPDILSLILRTLHDFYIKNEEPAVILETLRSLASVRRFDMAVMFMSSPEKKVLKELFDFLHQADLDRSSITALQKKYGV
uniref:RNA polymerase II-associated protein 3 n=1 Tax=Haplochromis burtoni TaxID=8153 RepID=A0A3Q2WQ21_HAPBU